MTGPGQERPPLIAFVRFPSPHGDLWVRADLIVAIEDGVEGGCAFQTIAGSWMSVVGVSAQEAVMQLIDASRRSGGGGGT